MVLSLLEQIWRSAGVGACTPARTQVGTHGTWGDGQKEQGLPHGSSPDSNIQVNTDRKAVENYSCRVMCITALQREEL